MLLWKPVILLLSSIAVSVLAPNPDHGTSLQVQTIRAAYEELGTRVTQAIRIQLGDISQIQRQQALATDFLLSVTQVCTLDYIVKTIIQSDFC